MNDHMLTRVENGLFEQISYPVLQDRQYESTVDVVKRVLYPFPNCTTVKEMLNNFERMERDRNEEK